MKNISDKLLSKLKKQYPKHRIAISNVRKKRNTKSTYKMLFIMHPKNGWLGGYIDDFEMTL